MYLATSIFFALSGIVLIITSANALVDIRIERAINKTFGHTNSQAKLLFTYLLLFIGILLSAAGGSMLGINFLAPLL